MFPRSLSCGPHKFLVVPWSQWPLLSRSPFPVPLFRIPFTVLVGGTYPEEVSERRSLPEKLTIGNKTTKQTTIDLHSHLKTFRVKESNNK